MYSERVAIILAGTEQKESQLRTHKSAGTVPRQFRRISGESTLFEQTRRRIGLAFPDDRTLTLVTRSHRRFYEPLLRDLSPASLVMQPRYRGTTPAILYALMRCQQIWPNAAVAVFPSHHYVGDDRAFIRHVDLAFEGIKARPDLVVMLGTMPNSAEVDYSWVENGERIAEYLRLFRVRRFWNKPPRRLAMRLWQLGYLACTSVLVAQLPVLLLLIKRRCRELYASFEDLYSVLGTDHERETIEAIYGRILGQDFMDEVSATCPDNLAVLPVAGVEWTDLGRPRGIIRHIAPSQNSPKQLAGTAQKMRK